MKLFSSLTRVSEDVSVSIWTPLLVNVFFFKLAYIWISPHTDGLCELAFGGIEICQPIRDEYFHVWSSKPRLIGLASEWRFTQSWRKHLQGYSPQRPCQVTPRLRPRLGQSEDTADPWGNPRRHGESKLQTDRSSGSQHEDYYYHFTHCNICKAVSKPLSASDEWLQTRS